VYKHQTAKVTTFIQPPPVTYSGGLDLTLNFDWPVEAVFSWHRETYIGRPSTGWRSNLRAGVTGSCGQRSMGQFLRSSGQAIRGIVLGGTVETWTVPFILSVFQKRYFIIPFVRSTWCLCHGK